ncbi:phosphatidylinositol 3,4,5-trisphosphate 3-phosphatase and protein-tyrosine-phosphatase PTEN2A-like [Silene latifolia]|uniref:phosphatidylinositol 3,4,5-trisphosphate 3-phosphatase and protein-tyrosine-phosphatase PTEN2A-like n=1 Tax=Silene latifolia TaxID=37657 RepID=UPI003D774A4F
MDTESRDLHTAPSAGASDVLPTPPTDAGLSSTSSEASSKQSFGGLSSWAKNLKIPQPSAGGQEDSPGGNSGQSAFSRFTSSLSMRLSPKDPTPEQAADQEPSQSNIFGTITRGLVDSSKSAVRAVSVKARHVVSQNKRRYQADGYDLDLTYITENILAMGFPAGDMSSGFFGYVEGFYRNHMEEVISFLESHHKGKYKVYNLCSERLYDASLFEGKVASFPFDDHNCPPIHLITLFCQSAYAWLKEDIENVVIVHCKAGMARTGLMISSLLLYLKFFPTAEESIDYYNRKRCIDAKALVLPSQIRYVKYFERVLTYFNGENQPGRRCMLRGFRLHRCPFWIRPHITVSDHNGVLFTTKKHLRTKDLTPEDFWFSAPKKGILVFALPGEPGLTELAGDFKVHFHDRQGDFYFWLNTTMVENRKIFNTSDMDGFDKRKLPSPGFQVEIVLVDYDGTPVSPQPVSEAERPNDNPIANPSVNEASSGPSPNKESESQAQSERDRDDVFSDDDESGSSKSRKAQADKSTVPPPKTNTTSASKVEVLTHEMGKTSVSNENSKNDSKVESAAGSRPGPQEPGAEGGSDFKAMAADASVFTFGDDEDYESE